MQTISPVGAIDQFITSPLRSADWICVNVVCQCGLVFVDVHVTKEYYICGEFARLIFE